MVRTGWDTGSTASAFGIAAHANVPSSSFVAPFIRPGSGEKYTLAASNRKGCQIASLFQFFKKGKKYDG